MTYPVVGLLASNGVVWLAKKINRQFGRAAFENPQIALP
jgi:hypothetical protein